MLGAYNENCYEAREEWPLISRGIDNCALIWQRRGLQNIALSRINSPRLIPNLVFPIAIEKCFPVPRIFADVGMISTFEHQFSTKKSLPFADLAARISNFDGRRHRPIPALIWSSATIVFLYSFLGSDHKEVYHQLPPENSRGPVFRHPSLVVVRQHREVLAGIRPSRTAFGK